MPFAWSPAALDDLHRLYVREKRSASQTARAMGAGLTRNAVLGKVQRMGWTRAEAPKPGRPPAPDRPRLVRPATAKPAPVRVRTSAPFSTVLPLPKLREITVISTPKLWTERAFGECAFPVGEPTEPGRQYACCAKVIGRGAYCRPHRILMTLEGTALSARDVDAIAAIARRAA